jgi:hypothetical protein
MIYHRIVFSSWVSHSLRVFQPSPLENHKAYPTQFYTVALWGGIWIPTPKKCLFIECTKSIRNPGCCSGDGNRAAAANVHLLASYSKLILCHMIKLWWFIIIERFWNLESTWSKFDLFFPNIIVAIISWPLFWWSNVHIPVEWLVTYTNTRKTTTSRRDITRVMVRFIDDVFPVIFTLPVFSIFFHDIYLLQYTGIFVSGKHYFQPNQTIFSQASTFYSQRLYPHYITINYLRVAFPLYPCAFDSIYIYSQYTPMYYYYCEHILLSSWYPHITVVYQYRDYIPMNWVSNYVRWFRFTPWTSSLYLP